MSEEAIVDCRNLSREYQMGEVTVKALRGLNLTLTAGEVVVLLGPSGSGKTTTLNLIGGLDRPTSGEIFFNGTNITDYDEAGLTEYRRSRVGFDIARTAVKQSMIRARCAGVQVVLFDDNAGDTP